MQNPSNPGLRIHASIRPDADAPAAPRPRPRRRFRFARRKRLSLGDRLLRDTAIACAALLGVLTLQNVDQPWSRLALNGVQSALTMRINLDESLGRLSFVRELVPESALVFFDLSAAQTFAPVEGTVAHPYSKDQPWIGYTCAPGAAVRALEPGTVAAVTQLSGGEWGVLVDHGGGVESVYAYMGAASVRAGDAVTAGQVIGEASANEDISFYFELRENGAPIDPAARLSL